jgi:hypothetical protein
LIYFQIIKKDIILKNIIKMELPTSNLDQICLNALRGNNISGSQLKDLQHEAIKHGNNTGLVSLSQRRQFCQDYIRNRLNSFTDKYKNVPLAGAILANTFEEVKREEDEFKKALLVEEKFDRIQENVSRAIKNLYQYEVNSLYENNELLKVDQCQYEGVKRLNVMDIMVMIDYNLRGRQIKVYKSIWKKIFNTQVERRLIAEDLLYQSLVNDIDPTDIENLSNDMVVNILGEDNIIGLIGVERYNEYNPSNKQINIRINGSSHPIYAIINGYHTRGKEIVEISEELNEELNAYGYEELTMESCHLETVDKVKLLLLYNSNDFGDISEDAVKERLIDVISEMKILEVGSIIPVTINKISLKYQIESIQTDKNEFVGAGKISETSQEIGVEIDYESKDVYKNKILEYLQMEGEINEDEMDFYNSIIDESI